MAIELRIKYLDLGLPSRKYSSSSILMVGCTNILTSVGVGGGVTIEPSLLLSGSIERVSGSESSSWTPLLLK